MRSLLRERVLAILLTLGQLACLQPVSDGGMIGPAGGEVRSRGVLLSVPAGALNTPTQLTITSDTTAPPQGSTAVGGAVRLGPEGLQFDRPVTLELQLTAEPSDIQIATAPVGTQEFTLLPAEHSGLRARAQISHFSIFIPVTPSPQDGGTDGGADAGSRDPLGQCQLGGDGVLWWTRAFDDAGVAAVGANNGESAVVELPGAWVFTVGPTIVSVDRGSRQVVSERFTLQDTPLGGSGRLAALRFPSELLFAAGRGSSTLEYVEWKMDLNGFFTDYPDAGFFFRQLRLDGTNPSSGGFNAPSPGVAVIASWDAVAVAAGPWAPSAIGIVPRDPGLPPWTTPLPPGVTHSTTGVELADGTVLIALNTQTPPLPANPTSVHTEVYVLARDGGLISTGWTLDQTPPSRGLSLASGGDGGAFLLDLGPRTVSIIERGAQVPAWVGALPDGGLLWPIMGPVQTTPSGLTLVLVAGASFPSRYNSNATPQDIYLVTYPPGKITRLFTAQRSHAPPGIGALRDDSFIFTFYDEATGIHAARLCLPR